MLKRKRKRLLSGSFGKYNKDVSGEKNKDDSLPST
jgi:hypothetical protein